MVTPAATGAVLVTDEADGVRVLTLSNPSRKNALDPAMLEQLRDAVAAPPPHIRCLLIRGAGDGIFCAGYDLNVLAARDARERLPDDHIAEVFDVLSQHRLPSVALITGPAYGAGCELAMACDLRVGDGRAHFRMPPLSLGLVYGLKGLARIASRVGVSATRFLFLSGHTVEAPRALQLGLLDLLETDAERSARALATQLAQVPEVAVEGTKLGLTLLGTPPAASFEREYERFETLRRRSFDPEAVRARLAERRRR